MHDNKASLWAAATSDLAYLSKQHRKTASIVFYTPHRFEGNLKYAFLETVRLISVASLPVKITYLTQVIEDYLCLSACGLPVLFWNMSGAKPYSHLLEAAVLVEDGHFLPGHCPPELFAALQGAKHVNLWHGTPIKKIHLQLLDSFVSLNPHFGSICRYAASITLMCLASEHHKRIFKEALRPARTLVTGYARNDILMRSATREDLINVDLAALQQLREARTNGAKIVMYAPTYRDHRPSWLTLRLLTDIASSVKSRGDCLVFRPHPYEKHLVELAKEIPNIIVPEAADIYPLLAETDLLITDYSSIIFDFALTERPIVLFRPDHEEYIGFARGLTMEMDQGLGLPTSHDLSHLNKHLAEARRVTSAPSSVRLSSLNNYYHDADASWRTARALVDISLNTNLKWLGFRMAIALSRKKVPAKLESAASPINIRILFTLVLRDLPDNSLEGFSFSESWGRWTNNDHARIRLPCAIKRGTYIFIEGRVFNSEKNEPFGFGTPKSVQESSLSGHLPAIYVCEEDNASELVLTVPHPTSPVECGQSDDVRRLGIALEKLTFFAVESYSGAEQIAIREDYL